jgi:hypothetical protein
MRARRRAIAAGLLTFLTVGAFAACTLNPQPLPPSDERAAAEDPPGGGFGASDSGSPAPNADSDAAPGTKDASADAPTDAAIDAPADAPSDGPTDGPTSG